MSDLAQLAVIMLGASFAYLAGYACGRKTSGFSVLSSSPLSRVWFDSAQSKEEALKFLDVVHDAVEEGWPLSEPKQFENEGSRYERQ